MIWWVYLNLKEKSYFTVMVSLDLYIIFMLKKRVNIFSYPLDMSYACLMIIALTIEIKIVGKNKFPIFLLKSRILHKLYMAFIKPCCYLFSELSSFPPNVGQFRILLLQPIQMIVVLTRLPFLLYCILPCSEGALPCLLKQNKFYLVSSLIFSLNSVYLSGLCILYSQSELFHLD